MNPSTDTAYPTQNPSYQYPSHRAEDILPQSLRDSLSVEAVCVYWRLWNYGHDKGHTRRYWNDKKLKYESCLYRSGILRTAREELVQHGLLVFHLQDRTFNNQLICGGNYELTPTAIQESYDQLASLGVKVRRSN
jgi:hypothetical protein